MRRDHSYGVATLLAPWEPIPHGAVPSRVACPSCTSLPGFTATRSGRPLSRQGSVDSCSTDVSRPWWRTLHWESFLGLAPLGTHTFVSARLRLRLRLANQRPCH